MGDNQRVFLKLPSDMDPSIVYNFNQIKGMLEELSQGQVTKTSGIATNVTSAETNATDIATNVTDIATNVTGISNHLADITTVHGKPNDKYDATAAPGVTNDVDEGYTAGSKWIDVTNDKEYVCLDNSDGAAVWTETTQSGGGGGTTFDTDFYGTMSGVTQLTNSTWGKIAFDTATRDANTEFNAGTDEWVAPADGTYPISVILVFTANSTGYRGVVVSVNGDIAWATAPMVVLGNAGTSKARVPLSMSLALSTSDTIEIYGIQSSGGNLNVETTSYFCVHRIQ